MLLRFLLLAIAASGAKNDPVCQQIMKTWWPSRLALNMRGTLSALDRACSEFSGNATMCNNRLTRTNPSKQLHRCMMAGAKQQTCLSNPCVNLNDGSCTIQGTGGQCYWHNDTGQDLSRGCYRNPCNLAGYTNNATVCASRSIPNLFNCTWCAGYKGMGCQMNLNQTKGYCAKIPSPERTVIQRLDPRSSCQCDRQSSIICGLNYERNTSAYTYTRSLQP
jgi:hypothetical protein